MERIEKALLEHSNIKKAYWQGEACSVDGIKDRLDEYCDEYIAYAYGCNFNILDDSLSGDLEFLDEFVNKVVSSSRQLKAYEKPEGEEVRQRGSVIHWREYPIYSYNAIDETLSVYFRITCQHAQIPAEAYT